MLNVPAGPQITPFRTPLTKWTSDAGNFYVIDLFKVQISEVLRFIAESPFLLQTASHEFLGPSPTIARLPA